MLLVLAIFSAEIFPQKTQLEQLCVLATQHNPDVLSAQYAYKLSSLKRKTLNGTYAPSVNFGASANIPDGYSWDAYLYSFSTTAANGTQYAAQSPQVSFTLTQSLLPFWALSSLQKSGGTNLSKIAELETSKWNVLQTVVEAQAAYQQQLQNIRVISGSQIDIEEEQALPEAGSDFLHKLVGTARDPASLSLELKKELVKTSCMKWSCNRRRPPVTRISHGCCASELMNGTLVESGRIIFLRKSCNCTTFYISCYKFIKLVSKKTWISFL